MRDSLRVGWEQTSHLLVMPDLVPGIHEFECQQIKSWMAGTSPAMTVDGD